MSQQPATDAIRRTPLHAEHVLLGARRSPFAGYDMPVFYTSIYEEAASVRTACGVFDVSHMARIEFSAADEAFLRKLLTCNVKKIPGGAGLYALILNEEGGILDDVILYRKSSGDFLLVVNASNRQKILRWMESRGGRGKDQTDRTAMLAVQGPRGEEALARQIPDCKSLFYFDAKDFEWPGIGPVWISRTGYTGEDGFELVMPAEAGPKIWKWLVNAGKVTPCGLGARDVLRIEAGYSLYGSDMDESVSPYDCGLAFAVVPGCGFIGEECLKSRPVRRRLVGLDAGVSAAGVMRHGFEVLAAGEKAGVVTSGVYSRTLSKSIAFASMDARVAADLGLAVNIRNRPVEVVAGSRRFLKGRVKSRRPR